jgi:methyl-accepting chemotaxis protein
LGNDVDLFRFGQVIRYGRYVYAGVYTSVLPEGFSAGRAAVLQAAAQAQVVDSLRPYLPYLGLWVFLLFVLPSTLMGVVLAWYLSARIAAPIRAINEAAGRLAGDDPSFILVPSSNDELGETALFLNAIAARLPARKKKLKIPDKAPPSGV